MTFVPLLGGPADGEVLDLDNIERIHQWLYLLYPVPYDPLAPGDAWPPPKPETYTLYRCYTEPDRWVQWVGVHSTLCVPYFDPLVPPDQIVRAIMLAWRAKWARTICKHCRVRIIDRGSGYVHADGPQQGMHTCAVDPYGFHAEPRWEACGTNPANPCNGARGMEPTKVYA